MFAFLFTRLVTIFSGIYATIATLSARKRFPSRLREGLGVGYFLMHLRVCANISTSSLRGAVPLAMTRVKQQVCIVDTTAL